MNKVVFTSLAAFVTGFMAPVFPYAGVCTFFVMLDVLSAWQLGVRIRRITGFVSGLCFL